MMRGHYLRAVSAFVIVAGVFLPAMSSLRTEAQSEFLGGQGFPYNTFDRLPATDIELMGGVIHLAFAPGRIALPKAKITEWVTRSAKAITTYYGRFPVKSARILIVPMNGTRVQGGTTWGYRGGAIRINLGSDADEEDLRRDWIMVHEMVHLALPDMNERYNWLSEGLAVYIEPIARVQAGDLPANGVWSAMMRDMPKGLPGFGDRGLDNTSAWGRIYWGGALFWLRADIAIRRRTDNRFSVQDALRAINRKSGGNTARWSVQHIVDVGDHATGTDVLQGLYGESRAAAAPMDLDVLFKNLGVQQQQGKIAFDDHAPLAAIRRQITQRIEPAPNP